MYIDLLVLKKNKTIAHFLIQCSTKLSLTCFRVLRPRNAEHCLFFVSISIDFYAYSMVEGKCVILGLSLAIMSVYENLWDRGTFAHEWLAKNLDISPN